MIRAIALLLVITLASCDNNQETSAITTVNWDSKAINFELPDSLIFGRSYLSVYSQIYSMTEHRKHNLTATISMRNVSTQDTIYILKAAYYDTHGILLRTYLSKPIALAPLETDEIVINEIDNEGGTGANFIFDWKIGKQAPEPLFEGVMTSTTGQQGLSFTTQGVRTR